MGAAKRRHITYSGANNKHERPSGYGGSCVSSPLFSIFFISGGSCGQQKERKNCSSSCAKPPQPFANHKTLGVRLTARK